MKMNRRKFIKNMNRMLAGCLAMLGFAGCTKDGLLEYGTPNADYTVKGAVVDKVTGKPIEGIRVSYQYVGPIMMYGIPSTPYKPKSHVFTDKKGEFKLKDNFHIGEYQTDNGDAVIPVWVEDVDGEKNGSYQSEQLQVNFKNALHSGRPKSWYGGEYTMQIKIELTEIDPNDVAPVAYGTTYSTFSEKSAVTNNTPTDIESQ